jgi:hypothetical protein
MDLQEAFDAGFEAVKKYMDDGFGSFEKRIAALEQQRPAAAGSSRTIKFDGEAFGQQMVEAIKLYTDPFDERLKKLEGAPGGIDTLELAKAMAPPIKKHMSSMVEPLEARLAAVEASGIRYCGVWQRANLYRKGSVVTEQGGAWVALVDNEGIRPGEGGTDAWQLMVRAGRDGRA